MITKNGAFNISAINVPGGYVNEVAPPQILQGAPSNILGIVGTAKWGPVNAPVICDYAGAVAAFGDMQTGSNDLVTQVYLAALQGCNNFRAVRVTDGTDAAATVTLMDTAGTPAIGATLTSLYTGTGGNGMKPTISAGTATGAYTVTLPTPNGQPEQFQNISGSGATFWQNLVSAINNGQNGLRGPSQAWVATIGTGTAAPNTTTFNTSSGGADGNSSVTSSTLLGTDGTSRTGMYALRATNCSVAFLSGVTDTTTWAAQIALANEEGWEAIFTGAAGQSVASAISAKASASVDDTSFKVLVGDYIYFKDAATGQTRLVSPQGVSGGLRAALSPELSVLNKQIYGIIGTQKSANNQTYGFPDLSALGTARIDVIGAPSPGGNYFSHLQGINGSSNVATMDDAYTTLTNYLAKSINSGIGIFVGRLQTPDEQREARDFIEDWLEQLKGLNMIEGYSVQLDAANNPKNTVAQGYQIASVRVTYFGTVRYFIVNLVGGASVVTTVQG